MRTALGTTGSIVRPQILMGIRVGRVIIGIKALSKRRGLYGSARVYCDHRQSQHETMKAEPSPPALIATLSRLAQGTQRDRAARPARAFGAPCGSLMSLALCLRALFRWLHQGRLH